MKKLLRKTDNGIWCISKKIDTNGEITEYQYDEKGRKTSEITKYAIFRYFYIDLKYGGYIQFSYDDTNIDRSSVFRIYNKNDQLILNKNPGEEKHYFYDEKGYVNLIITVALDENGNAYNRKQKTIENEYDDKGRLIKTSYSSGLCILRQYNENDKCYHQIEMAGDRILLDIKYYYDNNNNIKTIMKIDHRNFVVRYENVYDENNNLIETVISYSNGITEITKYEYTFISVKK